MVDHLLGEAFPRGGVIRGRMMKFATAREAKVEHMRIDTSIHRCSE
jgi:hypothetical protein